MKENDDSAELLLNAEQLDAAQRVAAMTHVQVPTGLAQRTLARWNAEKLAQANPARRSFWVFRPITNPVARLAAAAAIVLVFTPLMDLDRASAVGKGLENCVFNPNVVEHVESVVDSILTLKGPPNYAPAELELFTGGEDFKPQFRRTKNSNTIINHVQG